MKAWHDMTDKEKDLFLGEIGGCGKCVYWGKLYNNYPPEHPLSTGCTNPRKGKERYPVYDNGCEHIVVCKKPEYILYMNISTFIYLSRRLSDINKPFPGTVSINKNLKFLQIVVDRSGVLRTPEILPKTIQVSQNYCCTCGCELDLTETIRCGFCAYQNKWGAS